VTTLKRFPDGGKKIGFSRLNPIFGKKFGMSRLNPKVLEKRGFWGKITSVVQCVAV